MKKILFAVTAMIILCMFSGFATADYYGRQEARSWDKKEMGVMGKHAMTGTIEDVNHQTGWVKLKTGEGDMVVHFPLQSLAGLKSGDMISVQLSFSKAEGMAKGGEKMEDRKMEGGY